MEGHLISFLIGGFEISRLKTSEPLHLCLEGPLKRARRQEKWAFRFPIAGMICQGYRFYCGQSLCLYSATGGDLAPSLLDLLVVFR